MTSVWHRYEFLVGMITDLWRHVYQSRANSVCHAPLIFQWHYKLKFIQQKLLISQTNNHFKSLNSVVYTVKPVSTSTEGKAKSPCLTHCIPWTLPLLYVYKPICHFRGVTFILFLMENPISKQCAPWSDATLCGVWSGSALFAYDPFTSFQVRME